MKKGSFSILSAIGICLILISLVFMVGLRIRAHLGSQNRQRILSQMDQVLPERTPGISNQMSDFAMPVLEIEGRDYVALLEIPAFGITLPVSDQWSGSKLADSPARFSGSVYYDTLIIGGTDDPEQFGFCDQIQHGDFVTVTDMTGARFSFKVSKIDRANHAEAQWLAEPDYDLTLFCRNTYAMEYIAVRCVLAY